MTNIITYDNNNTISNAFVENANDSKLIEMFLHGKSKHSIRRYSYDIKVFFDFIQKPIRSITLEDIYNFTIELKNNNTSTATIVARLKSIKSLLSFAFKLNYLIVNISPLIELPRCKDTLNEKILSINEVRAMLENTTSKRDYAIIRVLFDTMLRVSELCNLQVRDVLCRNNTVILTVFGKGNKTRSISIREPKTIQCIKSLLTNNKNDYLFRSNGSPIDKSNVGGQLDTSAVYRIVKATAKRSLIDKDVSPHWLRHAGATDLANNNMPLHELQSALGHASIMTTEKYLHVNSKNSLSEFRSQL